MPNYARITIIGHACGDPESRQVNGKTVANFSVAVNDPFGPKGNDGKPIAVFYKVGAWERLADVALKYVKKGDAVMIEGRPSLESYHTRDGDKRTDIKVSASDIVLLGGGNKRDDSAQQGDNQERRSAPRTQPPADNRHAASDDLPF